MQLLFKRDQLFFTGNSILAALKSLSSIFSTCGNTPTKEFFQKLQTQYSTGILKNLAVYEVDKEMLHNTEFALSLDHFVVKQFQKLKLTSLNIKKETFSHQPIYTTGLSSKKNLLKQLFLSEIQVQKIKLPFI